MSSSGRSSRAAFGARALRALLVAVLPLALAVPLSAAVDTARDEARPPPMPPGATVRVDATAGLAIRHGHVARPIDRLLGVRAARERTGARRVIDALLVTPSTVPGSPVRAASNEPRRTRTKSLPGDGTIDPGDVADPTSAAAARPAPSPGTSGARRDR